MSYTAYIVVSLLGAAASGYLLGWGRQRLKTEKLIRQGVRLNQDIQARESETTHFREIATGLQHKLSSLEQLLQDHERQLLQAEVSAHALRMERDQLEQACAALEAQPKEVIREIEVIREVPVLIFREKSNGMTHREKAKQLVRAFRKGYLEGNEQEMQPVPKEH